MFDNRNPLKARQWPQWDVSADKAKSAVLPLEAEGGEVQQLVLRFDGLCRNDDVKASARHIEMRVNRKFGSSRMRTDIRPLDRPGPTFSE